MVLAQGMEQELEPTALLPLFSTPPEVLEKAAVGDKW